MEGLSIYRFTRKFMCDDEVWFDEDERVLVVDSSRLPMNAYSGGLHIAPRGAGTKYTVLETGGVGTSYTMLEISGFISRGYIEPCPDNTAEIMAHVSYPLVIAELFGDCEQDNLARALEVHKARVRLLEQHFRAVAEADSPETPA